MITGMQLSQTQFSCIKDGQLQVDELIADLFSQRDVSLSSGGLVTFVCFR